MNVPKVSTQSLHYVEKWYKKKSLYFYYGISGVFGMENKMQYISDIINHKNVSKTDIGIYSI